MKHKNHLYILIVGFFVLYYILMPSAHGQINSVESFTGHTDKLRSVTFFNNQNKIATGGWGNEVKIWNLEKADEVNRLQLENDILDIDIDQSDDLLAIATGGGEVKLWDQNEVIKTFDEHSGIIFNNPVYSVEFFSDESLILSAGEDGLAKIWEAKTGNILKEFDGHDGWVFSADISPGKDRIVTGSMDDTVKVWDVETGEVIVEYDNHNESVFSVDFSEDGQKVVSACQGSKVKIWEAKTGNTLKAFEHNSAVFKSTFFDDDKKVASATQNNLVKIWDIKNEKLLSTFDAHHGTVNTLEVDQDNERILTGSNDRIAKLWKRESGDILWDSTPQNVRDVFSKHEGRIRGASYNLEENIVATGGEDDLVKVWDLNSKDTVSTFEDHDDWVFDVDISSEGEFGVSVSQDENAKIWNIKTGELVDVFSGHASAVLTVNFSPADDLIATGSHDQNIILWQKDSGEIFYEIDKHNGSVWDLEFTPDEEYLVSVSADGTSLVWDLDKREPQTIFEEHDDTIRSLDVQGNLVITAGEDEKSYIWDIKTGEVINEFKHESEVVSASIDHSEEFAVTGEGNGSIKTWDISAEEIIFEVTDYNDPAYVSEFIDEKKIILSAIEEKAAFWEAQY